NAGTIELLVDVDRGTPYFIELNTRVQGEHPVTAMATGSDIITEQVQTSEGKKLSVRRQAIDTNGQRPDSRANAEDPDNNSMPAAALINQYIIPSGLGVRVETFCYTGYTINPFYDSMVGKVIVKGKSREEAIVKLKAALETFYVEGIKTTIPLHLSILD